MKSKSKVIQFPVAQVQAVNGDSVVRCETIAEAKQATAENAKLPERLQKRVVLGGLSIN